MLTATNALAMRLRALSVNDFKMLTIVIDRQSKGVMVGTLLAVTGFGLYTLYRKTLKKNVDMSLQETKQQKDPVTRPPTKYRIIHFFRKRPLFDKLLYVKLTIIDESSATVCTNDDDDNNDITGSDVDLEAYISQATAIKMLTLASDHSHVYPGTLDIFRKWLKARTAFKAFDSTDVNVFITWYEEFRTGLEHQAAIPIQNIPLLFQHLSSLMHFKDRRGFVWCATSDSAVDQPRRRSLSDENLLGLYSSAQTTRTPKLEYFNTLSKSEQTLYFYRNDWVNDDEDRRDLMAPYVTPFDRLDFSSPSVVRLWCPVLRSAARANYHVTKISTRFPDLFESRFRFYYDVNLSTTPGPGTYTYCKPF